MISSIKTQARLVYVRPKFYWEPKVSVSDSLRVRFILKRRATTSLDRLARIRKVRLVCIAPLLWIKVRHKGQSGIQLRLQTGYSTTPSPSRILVHSADLLTFDRQEEGCGFAYAEYINARPIIATVGGPKRRASPRDGLAIDHMRYPQVLRLP